MSNVSCSKTISESLHADRQTYVTKSISIDLDKKNEMVIRTTVEFPDRGTRGQSPLHFLDVVVFWKNML